MIFQQSREPLKCMTTADNQWFFKKKNGNQHPIIHNKQKSVTSLDSTWLQTVNFHFDTIFNFIWYCAPTLALLWDLKSFNCFFPAPKDDFYRWQTITTKPSEAKKPLRYCHVMIDARAFRCFERQIAMNWCFKSWKKKLLQFLTFLLSHILLLVQIMQHWAEML